MSAAEKAKQARAQLIEIDPNCIAAIDSCKGVFGAKLVFIRVADIVIGDEKKHETENAEMRPFVRYVRPEESRKEFERIKREIDSRDAARDRASGRRYQRPPARTQVPPKTQMAF